MKTIEPHCRFPYNGANMLTSKKNLFADFGVSKSQSKDRLEELESQIRQNFFKAAEALREIKENKLYLQVAETWEQYCAERLGRSIEAVRLQIKALEIDEKSNQMVESPLSEKDLPPIGLSSRQDKKHIKDLRKQARTPAKKSPQKPKEIEVEMADDKQRTKRWSQAMTKLNAAKDRDDEGFLEAIEKLLEDWGS